jgi:glycine hydroxymethyltransferase
LQKPFVTSGLRLGSPALTTRGFKELEFEQIAILIDQVLRQDVVDIKDKIKKLTDNFPIYR